MTRRAFLSHGTIASGFSPVLYVISLGWPIWVLQREKRCDQQTFFPKEVGHELQLVLNQALQNALRKQMSKVYDFVTAKVKGQRDRQS